MVAVNKNTRVVDVASFPAAGFSMYMPFFNGSARWFVGIGNNNVLVYDELWVLRTTITGPTHNAGIIFSVHFFNGKYCFIGTTGIRFGTYNEATDVWTNGTFLANEVFPLAANSLNGKVYIASASGGAPLRTVTVLDIDTGVVVDRQALFGGNQLDKIAVGANAVIIGTNGLFRVHNATTWAQIGITLAINNSIASNLAFCQGKFWITSQLAGEVYVVRASDGLVETTITGLNSPTGAVADANLVYVAEQGVSQLRVYDGVTNAPSGATVTSVTAAKFITS